MVHYFKVLLKEDNDPMNKGTAYIKGLKLRARLIYKAPNNREDTIASRS